MFFHQKTIFREDFKMPRKIKEIYILVIFFIRYAKEKGAVASIKKALAFSTKFGFRALIKNSSVVARETSVNNFLKSAKSSYFDEIQETLKVSPHFKEYDFRNKSVPNYDLKLICFYLPQFHPFKENNQFWGEGFTEWTNVTKSFPLFKGHNQPRFPKDLGYYDLRLEESIIKQVEIAKNYGIHGFCFHYYWFSGHKVMDTPVNLLLKNTSINMPFCICWANENWSRRWDGNDKDILLAQLDSPDDYLNFFKDITPLLLDSRYIKINGLPVIVIYRAELLKDSKKATDLWRSEARKRGFDNLHLILSESFGEQDIYKLGFDAAVDFAPNTFPMQEISKDQIFYHPDFKGRVYDYATALGHSVAKKKSYPFYNSICLEWDNTARKGNKGTVLHNCNPKFFGKWLGQLVEKKPLNNTIFINAWNEWAEGTYLEPDRKNGFAYLQECYENLNSSDKLIKELINQTNLSFQKKNDIAVIFHLHYFDAFDVALKALKENVNGVDFFISITSNINRSQIYEIRTKLPNCYLTITENRGRDVLPFLEILNSGKLKDYKACCKIHSKRSPHLSYGNQWRDDLYKDLLDTSKYLAAITNSEHNTAIWTSDKNVKKIENHESLNYKRLKQILTTYPDSYNFIPGTMFWFEPKIFQEKFCKPYKLIEFESEPLINDGSWAHVFERFFMAHIQKEGYKVNIIDSKTPSTP